MRAGLVLLSLVLAIAAGCASLDKLFGVTPPPAGEPVPVEEVQSAITDAGGNLAGATGGISSVIALFATTLLGLGATIYKSVRVKQEAEAKLALSDGVASIVKSIEGSPSVKAAIEGLTPDAKAALKATQGKAGNAIVAAVKAGQPATAALP